MRLDLRGQGKLELPEGALREALLNAMAHRDYRKPGDLQVHIFQDRVEFLNPGGLVGGLTLEALGTRSAPRNPLLFGMMQRMKLVEKVGSGLKRIREMCADQNCAQPIIEADKDFFRITFTRIAEGFTKDSSKGGSMGGLKALTERQREIVNLIKANPAITVKNLAEQLQINRSAVDKHLDALKRKGVLVRVGGTRGHWEINN